MTRSGRFLRFLFETRGPAGPRSESESPEGHPMLRRSLLVLGLLLVAPAAHAVNFAVGVHDAYLHLDRQDVAGNALCVDLGANGVVPGYKIHLVAVGDWNAGPGGDVQHGMLGVFSSDASLLGPTLLHRVPGAISASIDKFTGG